MRSNPSPYSSPFVKGRGNAFCSDPFYPRNPRLGLLLLNIIVDLFLENLEREGAVL